MDDLCLGVNLIFVLFHHFAGQNRTWVGKMINRLLPLFPSVIPSYCLKTQKLWNFLSIRSCIFKELSLGENLSVFLNMCSWCLFTKSPRWNSGSSEGIDLSGNLVLSPLHACFGLAPPSCSHIHSHTAYIMHLNSFVTWFKSTV